MFLNITKKQTKSEVDPTLQARVNKDLFNQNLFWEAEV